MPDEMTPAIELEAIDALRARHQGDPSLALLRAADADALPAPLGVELKARLATDRWAQAMVRGADAATDEAALDEVGVERVWQRIRRESSPAAVVAPLARRRVVTYFTVAAAAAAVVVATVWSTRRAAVPASSGATAIATPAAAAAPAALYHLPLDPAPVKLTARALVLRSPNASAAFADDAAPAFDAYRAGTYADAARAFAAIGPRYPRSVEVRFYQGVSELLAGDAAAARTHLADARSLDTGAFADDIAWYLAAADDRAGDRASARTGLDALCRSTSPYAARACAAASQFSAK